MFKLITAFFFLATAAARPGLLGTQTSLETIGAVISSIPTSITHQSQTQIHSSILVPSITSIAVPSVVSESRPLLTPQVLSSELVQQKENCQILTGGREIANEQQSLRTNQLLSGQNQIDREQRLLGLTTIGGNQQDLQEQIFSGQRQLIGEQPLGGRISVVGNQDELLLNEQGLILGNQRTNVDNIILRQQSNRALSISGQTFIAGTGVIDGSVNIGSSLDSLRH